MSLTFAMTASIKKLLVRIVGLLFIGLGILGLFLPILQGVLFLLIGSSLVFYESRWFQNLLDRLEERYPETVQRLRNLREPLEDSE